MNRTGLAGLVVALVAVPAIAASCGDDEGSADDPLPPIATTTTTTISLTTTTYIQVFYEVQSGDTLGKIARTFEVNLAELMSVNSIPNADDIQAGQRLLIPPATVVVDTLPATPTTAGPATIPPATDLAPATPAPTTAAPVSG